MTPVVRVVQKAAPAVVNLTCSSASLNRQTPLELFFENGFGLLDKKRTSLGSGIIVDGKQRLVLTNAHVITRADEIQVHLQDGRNFSAEIMGIEPDFDLAVLKIKGEGLLPEVSFADSAEIMPGETVIAIGNPFGFNHTVTTGVVSATNRALRNNSGILNDLIQTDAAINPGNSGGPLLNLDGELIGINTIIDTRGEGLGFAIPSSKAQAALDRITRHETPHPVWLGLLGHTLNNRRGQGLGLLVTKIFPSTPAARSRLKPGDVITKINAIPIQDADDYLGALRNFSSGEELTVSLQRKGTEITEKIKPENVSAKLAASLLENLWGIKIREDKERILISSAKDNSPASFLQAGDQISSINQKPVKNYKEFWDAFLRNRLADKPVLGIRRKGRDYYAQLIIRLS